MREEVRAVLARVKEYESCLVLILTGAGRVFFFCQAEDGIRVRDVTGVQTCALPISRLNTDLVAVMEHAVNGTLDQVELEWDRKSVVQGKSVELGGRRSIKKKK